MIEIYFGKMRCAALQYGPQCSKVQVQQQVAIVQYRMHSSKTSTHLLNLDNKVVYYYRK